MKGPPTKGRQGFKNLIKTLSREGLKIVEGEADNYLLPSIAAQVKGDKDVEMEDVNADKDKRNSLNYESREKNT